jgi:hypothetical protein
MAGGDARPIEVCGFEQGLAHGAVEGGKLETLGEECTVDVGEGLELFVEVALASGHLGIEGLEEFGEGTSQVVAIGMGAVFNVELEGLRLKDVGVLGEHAEEDAHEKAFEVVPGVAALFEGVMEGGHDGDGFDVELVGCFCGVDFVAGDEAEVADAVGKISERKLGPLDAPGAEEREVKLLVRFKVVEGEALEIGEQDVTRDLIAATDGLEVLDIVESLRLGCFKAGAGCLVFDQQLALPEQIDEAVGAAQSPDRLFERGDGAPRNAEDIEELVPEGLLVGLLACGRSPVAGEEDGPLVDFVPREARHQGLIVPGGYRCD